MPVRGCVLDGRDCSRHRAAIIDFADRRAIEPHTRGALDHLGRCRRCEEELAQTSLAIIALRRAWAEAGRSEPTSDAWLRLRARIERSRGQLWRWRLSLAGLLVGAGLVATLAAPTTIWQRRPTLLQEAGVSPSVAAAQRLAEQRAESDWLQQQRLIRVTPSASETAERVSPSDGGRAHWLGPDGLGVTAIVLETQPPAGRTA